MFKRKKCMIFILGLHIKRLWALSVVPEEKSRTLSVWRWGTKKSSNGGVLTIWKRSNLLIVLCLTFTPNRHTGQGQVLKQRLLTFRNLAIVWVWTHILIHSNTHRSQKTYPSAVTVSHHKTTCLGFVQSNHVTIMRSLLCESPPPTQSGPSHLQHQTLPFDDFTSMYRWASCTSSYLMSVIGVKREHHSSLSG